MKIAVTSTGQDLNSQIDPRFGRCQNFVFVDTDSMEFEAVANPNISAAGGAGIQSAQMVADRGAEVVLTGNCGPNAFQTLSAAGVQVIVGVSGTVRDAVEAYKSGQLQPTSGANVPEFSGMQQPGMGAGMSRGGGRGMGQGMGRGAGMGRGRMGGLGTGSQGTMTPGPTPQPQAPGSGPQQPAPPGTPQQPAPPPQSNPSAIQSLKDQIEELQKQVQQLTERLTQAEESKKSSQ